MKLAGKQEKRQQRQKQKPNSGLNLGSPRLIAAEASLTRRFLFYFFVLLLGISGPAGCFYTAFPIPVFWWAVIPCTVLSAAGFTVLFLQKRGGRRGIWLPILFTACLGSLFFLKDGLPGAWRNHLSQGLIRTVNYVTAAYAQKSDYNFITWPAEPAGLREITLSCTAFAVFVLFLTALLMAWLLIHRKNIFFCFLLTTPFLAVSLVFAIIPHYAAVTALLTFWAFLLLNPSSLRGKTGFVKRGNLFYEGRNTAVHPASLILLPILAACLLLVGVLFPRQNFQRSQVVEDLRCGLLSRPNMTALFRSGGVAGNVRRVNLQLAGDIAYTGQTVLRVQSSQKDTQYLKGFVGSVYTGQSWEALGEEEYRELNALLNEGKVQNFPSLFARLFPSNLDQDLYVYDLAVRNVGGNPRSIYIPYGLISGPDTLPGLDFVDDGYLRSDYLFGTPEYHMRAISLPADYQNTSFYTRLVGYFLQNARVRGEALGQLGLNKNFQRDFDSSSRQLDEWRVPEGLADLLSPEQASFAQAAQAYTSFVYAHYTQLPEELRGRLDQYRREHGLDTEHFPWPRSLARAVINQVHSENTYTLSPGLLPEGRDFVEYFLLENHRGYCMHFASATVALLRSAGVPARYAEGYTLSAHDVAGPDGWVDIPDSRAHAWAEIYLSGVGWVPVEATPGVYNGVMDHQTGVAAPADESAGKPQEEFSGEAPEEEISGEPSQAQIANEIGGGEIGPGGPQSMVIGTRLKVLFFFAVIALSLPALLINRKLRVASRRKRFRQKDHNQGALAVYDYILQLLPHLKSDLSFSPEIPENLYELVLKARFSRQMLTEQELDQLLDYAGALADQVRRKASLFRRFVFAYLYGLF